MILPGHLAAGYVVSQLVINTASPEIMAYSIPLSILGAVSGVLPDLDHLLVYFRHRKDKPEEYKDAGSKHEDHRDFISHTPLFWIVLGAIAYAFAGWAGSEISQIVSMIIAGGAISHLLMDCIEHGVKLLWPFSQRKYCLYDEPEDFIPERPGSVSYHWKMITKFYPRKKLFYIEILVSLSVLLYITFKT